MNNPLDIEQLRNDTPGCFRHIHLNNAGSSLPPRPVTEAILRYLETESLTGGYETALAQAADIQRFYETTARLLNAHPRNIAWASSATDAYNKALSAIPFEPGDVLLTTDDDYVSNQMAFLFLQKRFKVKILRAGQLPEGGVDPASVEELMDRHCPRLVAVTHVPTNSGLVQNVAEIGRLCRERDTWYLVDACQSAGQMPLDAEAIGCDFLSATMRKWLRGPRGAGFLYASDRALKAGLEPIFPDMTANVWVAENRYELADTARRFEYWEKNYALVVGAARAMDYALELGLENIRQAITSLAEHTRQRLAEVPGARVLDRGAQRCGIVTAHFEGIEPFVLKKTLDEAGINAGIAQTANALIDFHRKGVAWALRVSPHYYNTAAEIDRLIEVLKVALPG